MSYMNGLIYNRVSGLLTNGLQKSKSESPSVNWFSNIFLIKTYTKIDFNKLTGCQYQCLPISTLQSLLLGQSPLWLVDHNFKSLSVILYIFVIKQSQMSEVWRWIHKNDEYIASEIKYFFTKNSFNNILHRV